jgi:ADP-ribose pyrophosphatase YjhB (NUDIX family)
MKDAEQRFNIRVYGLLINHESEILLSSEVRKGFAFTKFPGGGLQWGEGVIACLKREWQEELGLEIEVEGHFYTTEVFQRSAFREQDQLISLYYKLNASTASQIQNGQVALDVAEGDTHVFEWKSINELQAEDLSFPIDRKVLDLLKKS